MYFWSSLDVTDKSGGSSLGAWGHLPNRIAFRRRRGNPPDLGEKIKVFRLVTFWRADDKRSLS